MAKKTVEELPVEEQEVLIENDEDIILEEGEVLEEIETNEAVEEELIQKVSEAAMLAAAEATKDIVKQIFDKRRVYSVSKTERRKVAAELSGTEKVVKRRGSTVLTEADYLKKEYDILLDAIRSERKKILYGVIIGLTTDEHTGQMSALVKLDNTKGYFRILIPVTELFPVKLEDFKPVGETDPEKIASKTFKYIKNEMAARIGGHIGFIPYDLKEKEKYCLATRLEAMQLTAYQHYKKLQDDGYPEIVEGMLAEAEVMAVRKDRVRVEVLGAETTIRSNELSWLSLGILTEEFKVGDIFNVRVTGIEEYKHKTNEGKNTYTLFKISASKKAAEKNPAELYYDSFNIGDFRSGIIKNTTEAGVFVNLEDKCDCLCGYTVSGVAAKGMSCIVEITDKKDDEKFIYGKIHSLF